MISKDRQYRTRDGREVRIYATDGVGRFCIHGAYVSGGSWVAASWRGDGRFWWNEEHENDLIEVKPRIQREVWLNVYPSGIQNCTHETKGLADKNCCGDRLACVKITIDCEEGEGL